MRIGTLAGLTLAGAASLAACGGGSYGTVRAASPPHAVPTHSAAVTVRTTQLGDVLVDDRGRTLYALTDDVNGTSTCSGVCAQSWPHLTVARGWKTGAGVDAATFHTAADGSRLQLVAGRWPLYRFAGDRRAGDVNGQGSLGKWFVVRPDGTLLKDTTTAAPSAPNPPSAMSGSGY